MANTEKGLLKEQMGQVGGVYSTVGTVVPEIDYIYVAIQVITDSVLTCIGSPIGLTSVTIAAGTIIYGRFTSVVITSGSIIAYQGI